MNVVDFKNLSQDLEKLKLGIAYDEYSGSDCWNNAITKVQCYLQEMAESGQIYDLEEEIKLLKSQNTALLSSLRLCHTALEGYAPFCKSSTAAAAVESAKRNLCR